MFEFVLGRSMPAADHGGDGADLAIAAVALGLGLHTTDVERVN